MTQVSGSIRNISAADIGGVAFVNWIPPTNENETVIDYYNVTLIGSHTNNSMLIHKPTSAKTYLHRFEVSETNYSAVSVEAVDICGQSSEPLQSVLNLISSTGTSSNPSANDGQQNVTGLGVAFAVMTTITIVLVVTLITLIVCMCK